MLESKFQTKLIKELEDLFPGCVILRGASDYTQGIPDIFVLYRNKWAALEAKKTANSPTQPNQPYYVDRLNEMSFAAFIYPENKEEVLNALQQTFTPRRNARVPKR